jgi:type IV pilus biogenesis protein PilP
MTPDKVQALSNMNTRQKVTAVVMILVVLVVIWQVSGMFGGKKTAPKTDVTSSQNANTSKTMSAAGGNDANGGMGPGMQSPNTPRPADVPQAAPMSDTEAALVKLQQETQVLYLKALNELQLLKVTRDIAQTNKDISTANLAKVVAEKKVVDLLAPPPAPSASETLKSSIPIDTSLSQDVKYSVISVSQLQYRWGAVLSYKGNLYNVHVGDVLPPDGSTVVSIAKDGVTLDKNGTKIKLSLIPVI